jgi:hypothetical protein
MNKIIKIAQSLSGQSVVQISQSMAVLFLELSHGK